MSDMQSFLHAQDDLMIVNSIQDVEPILTDCKIRADMGMTGSHDMPHMVRFPMVIIEMYCNDRGVTFQEWIQNPEHARAMINDPGLKDFRIHSGAV